MSSPLEREREREHKKWKLGELSFLWTSKIPAGTTGTRNGRSFRYIEVTQNQESSEPSQSNRFNPRDIFKGLIKKIVKHASLQNQWSRAAETKSPRRSPGDTTLVLEEARRRSPRRKRGKRSERGRSIVPCFWVLNFCQTGLSPVEEKEKGALI